MILIVLILIFIFFQISFSGFFYNHLLAWFSSGWSYSIDQMLFLPIMLIILLIHFKKNSFKKIARKIADALIFHRVPLVILILATVIAHGLIFNYYFFAEDVSRILGNINNNVSNFPFDTMNNGYPLFPFALSFLLFGTKVVSYNAISFFCFLASVLSFYWLIYLICDKKNVAFFAALFFATTPSFLDMFSWQGSVQGMSYVLGLSLASLIMLVYFEKFKKSIYYLLSILFFAAAVKTGFVRTAGLIAPIIFLFLFPSPNIKVKKLLIRVACAIPYLVIWIQFILVRFPLRGGFPASGISLSIGNYLSSLAYYITHLFFPSQLGRLWFPWIKENFLSNFESFSLVLFMGNLSMALFAIIALISFAKKRKNFFWLLLFGIVLIFGSLFYVPVFGSVPTNNFDKRFIGDVPPYGPGSRYVLSASLGMSVLFGTILWLISKFAKKNKLLLSLPISVLIINTYFSFVGHNIIVKSISKPDKIFMEQFFSMVPIDGKKKIIFSANPARNMLDVNVGGADWLYGFYKRKELDYVNSKEKLLNFINENHYANENIYAFYNNPETGAFADISLQIRKELLGNNGYETVLPSFNQEKSSTFSTLATSDNEINILKRPILKTGDLNNRFIFTRSLVFNLVLDKLTNNNFPYSDFVILNKNEEIPSALWKRMKQNYPATFTDSSSVSSLINLDSFNNVSLKDLPTEDKLSIIRILKSREDLKRASKISASSVDKEQKNISATSLMDGFYTTEPMPGSGEYFYLASSTPATISIEFPYAINLGRILLNTSSYHSTDRFPTKLSVFASSDGLNFEEAGSHSGGSSLLWSPNNGKMIEIVLKPIPARFIKIVVEETINYPVMFDEITVDGDQALKYSSWQIEEFQNKGFQFVDNRQLLDALSEVNYYNKLSLFYACAEDQDWSKQESNTDALVPGIWRDKIIVLNDDMNRNKISFSIDCYGSKLRKLIVIGPPYPSRLQINNLLLNEKE